MSTLETKTVSAACAGRMLGLGKAKTLQLVHSGRLPAKVLDGVAEVFAGWCAAHVERLKGIVIGDKPKVLIEEIAEDLLARFTKVPLIDKYDVYQHLMTYWAATMQDDVYIVAQEGWAAARQIHELVKNAEGKFTETPDITLGKQKLKAELIQPALMVARFFAIEQAALEVLEAKVEEAARALEEMDEEHGGEDGLLFEAKTDKGKLTAKSVKDRLKDIKGDKTADEERVALPAVPARSCSCTVRTTFNSVP
jgi:type I restriction enzyme M protein